MLDMTFDISPKAMAVAAYLSEYERPGPYNDDEQEYPSRVIVRPWYNCRERGLAFMLQRDRWTYSDPYLFFTVAEHRNGDSIVVLTWEGRASIAGDVTADQVPDSAWNNKTFFKPWEAYQAADWIYQRMEAFCQQKAA